MLLVQRPAGSPAAGTAAAQTSLPAARPRPQHFSALSLHPPFLPRAGVPGRVQGVGRHGRYPHAQPRLWPGRARAHQDGALHAAGARRSARRPAAGPPAAIGAQLDAAQHPLLQRSTHAPLVHRCPFPPKATAPPHHLCCRRWRACCQAWRACVPPTRPTAPASEQQLPYLCWCCEMACNANVQPCLSACPCPGTTCAPFLLRQHPSFVTLSRCRLLTPAATMCATCAAPCWPATLSSWPRPTWPLVRAAAGCQLHPPAAWWLLHAECLHRP